MAGMLIRILSLLMLLSLTACGDDRPEQIAQLQQLNDQRLEKLGQMLDKDQLRNGILLKQYGQILAQQRPELQPLVEQLTLDATSKGPLYKSLESRVKDARWRATLSILTNSWKRETTSIKRWTPACSTTCFQIPSM